MEDLTHSLLFSKKFTPFLNGDKMFNNQFHSECRTWDDSPEPGKRKIGVIGAFCHVVFLFISMFLL